jgi:desulfoferrodoxin (superoxide reductase-like protein)
MQSSTKLRAESVVAEIQANSLRHSEDMMVMMTKLKEIRSQKSAFADQRKSMFGELEIQYANIHELWLTSVAIQKDEGHDQSPEPTDEGPFPLLDVDCIFKSVQEQDQRLIEMITTRDKVHAKYDIQRVDIKALGAKYSSLVTESTEIIDTSRRAHKIELERTEQNEKFIADLETERNDVMTLRTAQDDLGDSLHSESKDLEEKLKIEVGGITRMNRDLDRLRHLAVLNKDALVEIETMFKSEKCQSDLKLNETIKETNEAKAAFEDVQREAEALQDKCDLALEWKTDEIIRARKHNGRRD